MVILDGFAGVCAGMCLQAVGWVCPHCLRSLCAMQLMCFALYCSAADTVGCMPGVHVPIGLYLARMTDRWNKLTV